MKIIHSKIFLATFFFIHSIKAITLQFESTDISPTVKNISVLFNLQSGEALLKDFLSFSSNNPEIFLSAWQSTMQPTSFYDKSFHDYKIGWTDSVTISLTAQKDPDSSIENGAIILHYLLNTDKSPQEKIIRISFPQATVQPLSSEKTESVTDQTQSIQHSRLKTGFTNNLYTIVSNFFNRTFQKISSKISSWKNKVSDVVNKQESLSLRLLFSFLLGILMSLTPCIYPMIPITIGILQASTKSPTLQRNFLLALSYTLGIAITFAFLGLLAACGSAQFGQLMGNPIFVIIICFFLAYLALSLFGFYEMYIPRFLQPKSQNVTGSYISAFIFGAFSGTFASPCLSPGLALLLSVCATIGYKIQSFLLLFMFGCGLGLPLLIIGTFSNSMNMLPSAGAWMVEVKKVFGFMLFGMCFYYASAIVPHAWLLTIAALFLLLSGLYYFSNIEAYDSRAMKQFKNFIGFVLILASMITFFNAYKASSEKAETIQNWLTNYEEARQQAARDNKKILLDFGASWCSSCNAIDKHILNNSTVKKILEKCICVKVDCTKPNNEPCATLQKKFNIIGVPAIVLINADETIVKRWGSELLDQNIQEFIDTMSKLM